MGEPSNRKCTQYACQPWEFKANHNYSKRRDGDDWGHTPRTAASSGVVCTCDHLLGIDGAPTTRASNCLGKLPQSNETRIFIPKNFTHDIGLSALRELSFAPWAEECFGRHGRSSSTI